MTPLVALTWSVWAPHRAWHALAAVCLVLLCLGGLTAPVPTPLGVALAAPVLVAFLLALTSAAQGFQGRMEAPESGLPVRVLLLPVPSWLLAVPAFVTATVVPAGVVLLLTACVLRPGGTDAPLAWPGLLLAAFAGWLVVITWAPFPLPWLRLVPACGLMLASWLAVGLLAGERVPLGLGEGLLLAQWPLIFLALVASVRAARRGAGVGAAWPALGPGRPGRRAPFRSPGRALGWLEYRAQRRGLLAASFCTLPPLIMTVVLLERVLLEKPFLLEALGGAGLGGALGVGWVSLAPLLLSPPFGMPFAFDLGRVNLDRRDGRIADFLATRPVSDVQILVTKVWHVGAWLGVQWAFALLFALAWSAARGHLPDMTGRVAQLAGGQLPGVLLMAGLAGGAFLLVWARLVGGLWAGLLGRPWVVGVLLGGVIVVITVAGLALDRSGVAPATAWTWALGGLLAAKGVAAVLVAGAVLRRGVARPAHLALAGLAWGLLTLMTLGLAWPFVPAGVPAWWVAGGAALAAPLSGFGLAPLALASNRHR